MNQSNRAPEKLPPPTLEQLKLLQRLVGGETAIDQPVTWTIDLDNALERALDRLDELETYFKEQQLQKDFEAYQAAQGIPKQPRNGIEEILVDINGKLTRATDELVKISCIDPERAAAHDLVRVLKYIRDDAARVLKELGVGNRDLETFLNRNLG